MTKTIETETLFSAFEMFLKSDFLFTGERHNFWEFLYVLEGTVGVAVEDRVYELEGGKMIFYAPMEFHSIWSEKGTSPHIIIMSFSLSGQGADKMKNGIYDVGEKEDFLIKAALKHAYYCKNFDDDIKSQLLSNKLEELILTLMQAHRAAPKELKKTAGIENYKMIINVMKNNIEKNLTSSQLAALCGHSLSNLKKIFKKFSGVGVMKYYTNLRILKAMDLIRDGKSMAEVSDMLNFSSQNYFTEAFKRQCGMTPTEHRKRYVNV